MSAINSFALLMGLGILASISALAFLLMHPQKALAMSFLIVILAETKFRSRDPHALLAGDVDAQIIYELALYGLLLLILIINLFSVSYRRLKLGSMELLLAGYILIALGSFFWSFDMRLTAVRGTQLLILYGLGLVAFRVLGVNRVFRSLTLSVVVYVFVCSLMELALPWESGARTTYTSIERFSWFAVHPGLAADYAATAAIFIILHILFYRSGDRQRPSPALQGSILPLIAVLLATRTRAQLVGFVFSVMAVGSRKYVNPWFMGLVSYGLLALFSLSIVFHISLADALKGLLNQDSAWMSFLLRGQSTEEFLSVTGRVELWSGVYSLFLDRPLLGYGYVASRRILLTVLPWAGHAHNSLAESLLGVGMLGSIFLHFAFVKTLLSSLWRICSDRNYINGQQASILAILLYLLFLSFTSPSFAGPPSYNVLLFFVVVFAQERLCLTDQPVKRGPLVHGPHSVEGGRRDPMSSLSYGTVTAKEQSKDDILGVGIFR